LLLSVLVFTVNAQLASSSWNLILSQYSGVARPFRYGHSCVMTTAARMYCFSGIGANGGSVPAVDSFIYYNNQKLLTEVEDPNLNMGSRVESAYVLSNGELLTIYGGYLGSNSVPKPYLAVLNVTSKSWINGTEQFVGNPNLDCHNQIASYGASAAVDPATGDVYIWGGSSSLVNHNFLSRVVPSTFTYYQLPVSASSAAAPDRRYGSALGYYQGKVYVLLGVFALGNPGPIPLSNPTYYADLGVFTIAGGSGGTWVTSTPGGGPSARYYPGFTTLADGQTIVVFGGRDGSNVLNDVFSFDMSSSTWGSVSPSGTPPSGRDRIGTVHMFWPGEDSVMFYGGADLNFGPLDEAWYLTIFTNSSSPAGNPPVILTSSSNVLASPSPAAGSSSSSDASSTPPPVQTSGAAVLESWVSLLL